MLQITDDLDALIDVLPERVADAVRARPNNFELLEVVLDLGRVPEARYPGSEVILSEGEVSEEDIDFVVDHIGEFTSDNRAGIERTLHRISCIRNRKGRIVGLTCRVGRAVLGTIRIVEDLVRDEKSVLLLGRPGVGKTTMLREIARFLADEHELNKRVVIVDTSNEIAGDGDIPHPGIGSARRMQVPSPELQHRVMIEAVENHMPEVIIIDEIGTDLEAAAARTIAERGVQLIATAHGNTLENLIMNPTLSDLVGGVQSVTLSDEEARRRGTQKAILERRAPPTFDVLVEIQSFAQVSVHRDVGEVVDAILRGYQVPAEVRSLDAEGNIRSAQAPARRDAREDGFTAGAGRGTAAADVRERRIYPFGISRQRLTQALRETHFPGRIVDHLDDADAVITLRPYYRRKPQTLHDAEARGVPIYVVKSNTVVQLEQSLMSMRTEKAGDPVVEALKEAEDAIGEVINEDSARDLNPQNAYVRRLQHMLAQRYNLDSKSMGKEPYRHVRILPGAPQ